MDGQDIVRRPTRGNDHHSFRVLSLLPPPFSSPPNIRLGVHVAKIDPTSPPADTAALLLSTRVLKIALSGPTFLSSIRV